MANQQAIDYINEQLAKRVSKEVINNNLLVQGWEKKDIDEAFFVIESMMKSVNIATQSNIISSQTPVQASPQAQSPTPIINIVQPNSKGNSFWKIFGIILACIIILAILFITWGFYLIKTEPDLSDNQQQKTTINNQNDNTSMEEYLVLQTEASEYRKFADKVVEELAKGNTKYLNDNLSHNLFATNSQDAVDSTFLQAAKKLFTNFDHIGNSVTIQPSTDSYKNSGYSFAMTAVYKDNSEKGFKIYVIKEGGKLVVGNIVD